ncbi:hypothetical protein T4A_2428 [Trichinella pseudospiralis]|uniref:Uncharacterized protein n=1 Tax=Trichinella pseudospiralis TaxID=6337 RepID=A0A0V1K7V6_TRIPS|nr:hypothetical protein T4A_2428 [Trichinella pseudospiralis]KRZ43259.1 hypothetical protein T4C_11162 [Trichinella pseudospiralis]
MTLKTVKTVAKLARQRILRKEEKMFNDTEKTIFEQVSNNLPVQTMPFITTMKLAIVKHKSSPFLSHKK